MQREFHIFGWSRFFCVLCVCCVYDSFIITDLLAADPQDGPDEEISKVQSVNPSGCTSWQIDFQAESGGAYGSRDPVTSKYDTGYGPKWNDYTIKAFNADFDTAMVPKPLSRLRDAHGNLTKVSFALLDRVLAYNCRGLGSEPSTLEAATGDHFFFAQGSKERGTADPIRFRFQELPPGTYTLTVYCNPTVHNPPRGFKVEVGDSEVTIRPKFVDNYKVAEPTSIVGEISGIHVSYNGELSGRFVSIPKAGDPSVAALRIATFSELEQEHQPPKSVSKLE